MPGRPPLTQPEEGCQLGRKWEGEVQSVHGVSQTWLPCSQRKNGVIPLRSAVKGIGWRGPQSVFKEEKFPLGDNPQPEAEFLQQAGPLLLHPWWVCRAVIPQPLPRPSPILPSSWDGKVSVALTRPLELRSCSQNNPLAGPASFKVGGVFQTGLALQTQGVVGGMSTGS